MKQPLHILFALLLAFTGVARAQATSGSQEDTGPKEFTILEAKHIVRYKMSKDTDLPARFNSQRPYAISVCRDLANTVKVREELIQRLAAIRMLDQVVFEWFDVKTAEAFVVDIGNRVPVGVAQAALRAATSQMKDMQVVLMISTEGEFDDVQRIYLGSRVSKAAKPLSDDKLAALLKPGLTRQEFFRIAQQ